MARYEEVQAAQIREGEHRGAANRLRTEHKEVGSGPGAGSAEVGADGGPTPAGSGESFPASFDRMVAFFRRSKGVFQQAAQLIPFCVIGLVSNRRTAPIQYAAYSFGTP